MIWLSGHFERDNLEIDIIGEYNHPPSDKNIIEIKMVFEGEERLIFSHNPRGLGYEEPTSDEIAQKYFSMTRKILEKAATATPDELRVWKT
jgi:hypothetical protein